MAEFKAGKRRRAPTPPGVVLANALKALDISARAAAIAMGITPQALGNVIGLKSAITPEMALRIGTYIGNGPELWLGMQIDADLWNARQALASKLKHITPAARAA